MTQQYDNNNRGVLFKNDRKESDKHPDYKGNINVAGVEFWLSAWIKDGAKGKFMSLSIQPKEAQQPAPKKPDPISSGRSLRDEMSDDVPF
jgi:hypothetical protein